MRMPLIAIGALAFVVAACGGGGHGGGSPIPSAQSTPLNKPKGTFSLKLSVPQPPANANTKLRRRYTLSQATDGIVISAFTSPESSNPTPVYVQAYDVSPGSANCTTNADQSRTCALYANLNAGTYDVQVETYADVATGTTPPPVSPLGYGFVASQVITSGGQTNLNVTVAGIVSAVGVTLPVPVVSEIDALSQNAAVTALDASGSVIVGSYVDEIGNPVTITMSDLSGLGYLTFTPATFTSSQATGVNVYYWPGTSFSMLESAVTMKPQAAAASALGAITSNYAILQSTTAVQVINATTGSAPEGIIAGPDGNMWVAESGAHRFASFSVPNGTETGYGFPSTSAPYGPTPAPEGMLKGPDGNIWATLGNGTGPLVVALNTSGAFVYAQTPVSATTLVQYMATDGTSVFWSEPSSGNVGAYVFGSSPPVEETPVPTSAAPATAEGMVKGPDGRIWVADASSGTIDAFAPGTTPATVLDSAVAFSEYSLPTAGSGPDGICTDGTYVWVMQSNVGEIAKVVGKSSAGTVGSATELTVPNGLNPENCVIGPDGNLWFTTATSAAGADIGRYNISAGTFQVFSIATPSQPDMMAVAPNRTVWVTDVGTDQLYEITP